MESKYESKTFPLNDFNITLSLNHSQLTIKAEHSSTLDEYSLSVNNDTAKHLTNEFCEDVGTLYRLLLECLENKVTESTLSINNEALLTYQANIRVANALTKFRFTIQLEKKVEDPLSRMEKKNQLLLKKIDDIKAESDARFQEWGNFFKRYERDQEKIEDRFHLFEETLQKKLSEIIPRIENLTKEIKTIKSKIINPNELYHFKNAHDGKLIQILSSNLLISFIRCCQLCEYLK